MKKAFGWLADQSARWPWLVVAIVFIITVIAVNGITRIEGDFNFNAMLPEGEESVQVFEEIEDIFGGTLQERVLLKAESVLDPEILRAVAGYEEYLEGYPEIWGKLVDEVTTPLDGMYLLTEGEISFDIFGRPVPLEPDNLSDTELRAQVEANLTRQRLAAAGGFSPDPLVSEDGTAMLISLDQVVSDDDRLTTLFEDISRTYFEDAGVAEVFITGQASWTRDSNKQVAADTSILFMLAVLFILVILFLTFRRLSDVGFTMLVVLITIIWVMGLSGWLKIPFTYPSIGIMPLLLGIDIAYAIHVLTRYYEERKKDRNPYSSANISLKTVGIAVFLTAITTAVGFASFGVSEIPPMRDFGFMCLAGVLLSFALAVTLLPAVVIIRDRRGGKARGLLKRKDESERSSLVDRVLVNVSLVAEHHRKLVVVFTVVVLGLAVFSAFNLGTEAEFQQEFSGSPAAAADKEIDKYFGGQVSAYTLVKGDVLEPDVLESMLEYEQALADTGALTEEGEEIFQRGKIVSIADVVASQNDGTIPDDREDISRIIAAVLKSGRAGRVLSPELEAAMILSTISGTSQSDLEAAADVLREQQSVLTDSHPDLLVGQSGEPVLVSDLLGSLTPTLIKTSLLALLLCLLVVSVIFRSFVFGLAATSVVFLSIALELIALYLLGWPLDFMTVMVTALIIGAGIDFGIHVTHRFREEWEHGCENVDEAVRLTVGNVGRALLSAAVTTAGAFAILAISRIVMMRRFGGVTALSLVFALLVALLVLPTILSLWAERVDRKKGGRRRGEECDVI